MRNPGLARSKRDEERRPASPRKTRFAARDRHRARKALRPLALFASLSLPAIAWCQTADSLPADQAGRCRYGAEHMIEFAKQSLTDGRSRPKTIEKRRKLIEEWTVRLKRGEDPCVVYLDIQKAATTF